jgi:hypothetical protein
MSPNFWEERGSVSRDSMKELDGGPGLEEGSAILSCPDLLNQQPFFLSVPFLFPPSSLRWLRECEGRLQW